MWQPILWGDFFGPRFLLGLGWATRTHGRHYLCSLLSAEVLTILAEQTHNFSEGIGRLLLAELALLFFELPEFFLQLGLGGGDGVQSEFAHQFLPFIRL